MNFFKPKFWDENKISLFSILLYPITLSIKILFFIKKNLVKNHKFKVPIICVGNIYIGGTGKTPFCIELFSILEKLNKKPGFIRKKYKSFEDEILLLEKSGKVYQHRKRIEAIKEAINNNHDVLILDDGFQDLSVEKDLSIICFNEQQWIGNGFTIPSGPLREELSSLKRAKYVIINGKKNENINQKILSKNNKIKIFYAIFQAENIGKFKDKKIYAFAGIGNPNNFFYTLKKNKINVTQERYFPDHHNYSDIEMENLIKKSRDMDATLLTTEKDYCRIKNIYKKDVNFLKVNFKMVNENKFVEDIKKELWKA